MVLTRKLCNRHQTQDCMRDVSGSVAGVVRSRSMSCGHRQHTWGIIRLIKPTVLCLADDQQRLEEAEQI